MLNFKKPKGSPIFIVGCGHSGTSLLLAILGEHPRIFAVPKETGVLAQDDFEYYKKKTQRFENKARAAGKQRWVEKTPKHVRHIDKIFQWEPNAKVILIIRDGRDVAYSFKQRRGNGVSNGIQRWVNDNLAGKAYWSHPQVHVIQYEKVISDFETSISELMSFLGEEYFPAMEKFHETPKKWYAKEITKPESELKSNHRTYRNWQINQPLFDGRGKSVSLSDEEMSTIIELAGPLLNELGYT